MKTLYLHIGSHKTGSSSIQQALFQNRDNLAGQGLSLFSENQQGELIPSGNTSNAWVSAADLRDELQSGRGVRVSNLQRLAERLAELPGDVVMSAENFSWVFSIDEVKRIGRECRRYFDRVQVIVYLRRQDRQVISHHQQGSKNRHNAASAYYSGDAFAIPLSRDHYDEYLNYYKRVSMWAEVFGAENLSIRVFEPDLLEGGEAVTDFFTLLGMAESADLKSVRENRSLGFERTKVGHLLNATLPNCELSSRIRSMLDNRGRSLPSAAEAKAFYARYVDSNRMLNREFAITSVQEDLFNDDFSIYPEQPGDRWSEDSVNSAIEHILTAIAPLSGLKVEDLRDAAIALESSDIAASYRLMSIAYQLSGSASIGERLVEYRRRMSVR
ncbi:hypothetical protein BOW53_13840 [Solemya pervernicosa gill symbiont]|uniref:Sulfotransferase domain-containing protein n=1 Tax=Solemya pervernicosa gill symbiont TaxID=642797 RepID=A0A1T2L1C4_9GAMM|nr:hypothetical protein [Solemya pervernicosa gill symbiont]OOZ38871.1 hypothetical protein BOW53_13840 [Solemya pervernicosa gill symbiont]